MDVANHFRTIWRRRAIVLGAALAAAIVVFVWRSGQPDTFEAETRLRVAAAPSDQGSQPTGEDAVFIASGYVEQAGSSEVLSAGARRSGLDLRTDEVRERVSVDADPDSPTITVTAAGPSAADAGALSDAVATSLVSIVERDQQQAATESLATLRDELTEVATTLATVKAADPERVAVQARHDALVRALAEQQLRPTDRLSVMSPADRVSSPVGPGPASASLFAFLVALVVSAELVVAATALKDRTSREHLRDEVSTSAELPVLATVRRDTDEEAREAFRELRTNLALMTTAFETPSTVAVLGVAAGVGCTRTAIELARAASAGSQTVLLVDADMRRPAIHDRLGLPLSPGLSDVLDGAGMVEHPLATAGVLSTLSVLPRGSGARRPGTGALRGSPCRVLEPAARQATLTIFDVPPIAEVVDAAVVAAQCDTVILVVSEDTPRRTVRHVVSRLRQIGVIPLGIVVNGRERSPGVGERIERWLGLPEPPQQPEGTADQPEVRLECPRRHLRHP